MDWSPMPTRPLPAAPLDDLRRLSLDGGWPRTALLRPLLGTRLTVQTTVSGTLDAQLVEHYGL
jgi:hypothetical protein